MLGKGQKKVNRDGNNLETGQVREKEVWCEDNFQDYGEKIQRLLKQLKLCRLAGPSPGWSFICHFSPISSLKAGNTTRLWKDQLSPFYTAIMTNTHGAEEKHSSRRGLLRVWVRGSVFIPMFRAWAGLPQPAPHCVPRLGEALRAHTKPIKRLMG